MSKKRTTQRTRKRTSQRRRPQSKNRKLKAEGFRMPATFSLMMVLLFGVGISYLWLCSRNEALARQIKVEEQDLEDLRRQVAAEEVRWSDLIGPRNLRRALHEHGLSMKHPDPSRVVHIRDMALWVSMGGEGGMVVSQLDRGGPEVP